MNPETGLPELPEDDLFWRVNPNSVEIWRNLPDTEWVQEHDPGYPILEISLDPRFEERIEPEWKKVTRKWVEVRGWWIWKKRIEREQVRTDKFVRLVDRKKRIVQIKTKPTGEWEFVREGGPTPPTDRLIPSWEYEIREPVTNENLLGLCEKALERYEDSLLVGDYPPKKFEGGVQ